MRIGKYQVEHLIGEGSSSRVYLAYDPFSQRQVAIKQPRREMLNDPTNGRIYRHLLMNEASLVGKLDHPHIVQIYDASVSDDDAYVVMEYVPGGTLETFTRSTPLLSFERLIEIIFKATRALDYAFRKGITHRDIKPANILIISPESQDIKLTDFGIAFHNTSDATQVSGIGSPAYMSPEQIHDVDVDQRSDIYSLGVVMFQLLTGRLPFESKNNYSMLYHITHEHAPPPSALRPDIPASLDAIVQRATARDVGQRYQSWAQFSIDLAQIYHNRTQTISTQDAIPESKRFQTLRNLPFFREFSDVELWEIIGFSKWERVPPGTCVMHEDEAGDSFCILASGEAHVKKNGVLLHILIAGDCFGEMAIFSDDHTRTASVEAAEPSSIITIPALSLQRASDACRMHFYKTFLEVLASRLNMANTRITD